MIYIKLDEYTAPIEITSETTAASPRTGKQVRWLTGHTQTSDVTVHEAFIKAIREQGTKGLEETTRQGDTGRYWLLSYDRYSVQDNMYTYSLRLQEVEQVTIQTLIIDSIETTPIRYEEEYSYDELKINALVMVSPEDGRKFREHQRNGAFFSVVRKGINDDAVQMRFGMCGWSEHPDGEKHALYLLDGKNDATRNDNSIVTIDRTLRHRMIASNASVLDELIKTLTGKGVLTATEVSKLKELASERIVEKAELWRKVRDAGDIVWD